MKRSTKARNVAQQEEMIKLRNTIDPITGMYYTLQSIGDKYGLCRERVRQIIGNTGFKKVYPSKK